MERGELRMAWERGAGQVEKAIHRKQSTRGADTLSATPFQPPRDSGQAHSACQNLISNHHGGTQANALPTVERQSDHMPDVNRPERVCPDRRALVSD